MDFIENETISASMHAMVQNCIEEEEVMEVELKRLELEEIEFQQKCDIEPQKLNLSITEGARISDIIITLSDNDISEGKMLQHSIEQVEMDTGHLHNNVDVYSRIGTQHSLEEAVKILEDAMEAEKKAFDVEERKWRLKNDIATQKWNRRSMEEEIRMADHAHERIHQQLDENELQRYLDKVSPIESRRQIVCCPTDSPRNTSHTSTGVKSLASMFEKLKDSAATKNTSSKFSPKPKTNLNVLDSPIRNFNRDRVSETSTNCSIEINHDSTHKKTNIDTMGMVNAIEPGKIAIEQRKQFIEKLGSVESQSPLEIQEERRNRSNSRRYHLQVKPKTIPYEVVMPLSREEVNKSPLAPFDPTKENSLVSTSGSYNPELEEERILEKRNPENVTDATLKQGIRIECLASNNPIFFTAPVDFHSELTSLDNSKFQDVSNVINDNLVKQRKDAVIQSLKNHLQGKSIISHDEVAMTSGQQTQSRISEVSYPQKIEHNEANVQVDVSPLSSGWSNEFSSINVNGLTHEEKTESRSTKENLFSEKSSRSIAESCKRDGSARSLSVSLNYALDKNMNSEQIEIHFYQESLSIDSQISTENRLSSSRIILRLRSLAQNTAFFIEPPFYFIFNSLKSATMHFMLCLENTKSAIIPPTMNFVFECIEDWSIMLKLTSNAAKTLVTWTVTMKESFAACFVSVHLSMVTELLPAAPKYNFPFTLMLLCLQVKPVDLKYHPLCVFSAVIFSICLDINWLILNYIKGNGAIDNVFSTGNVQEKSSIEVVVWYALMVNIPVKIICLNFSLKLSERGNAIRKKFWQRVNIFCTLTAVPENLIVAAREKVIAILWIEIVCSFLLYSYFFIIYAAGYSSDLWQDAPRQWISLQATLLYKGTSGLLVFLSLVRHVRARDFCTQFGCALCYQILKADNRRDKEHERITSTLEKSLRRIVLIKVLDFIVGVLLWSSLVSVYHDISRVAPHETIAMFILICSTHLMTHLLSPVLEAVVVIWVQLSRKNEKSTCRLMTTESTSSCTRKREVSSRQPPSNENQNGDALHDFNQIISNSCNHIKSDDGNIMMSPRNSQSLHEHFPNDTSILSTSISPPTLDMDITCTPHDFQLQWENLPKGFEFSCEVMSVPSLSECHRHFHPRRFYVIASGVVGHETKLFLIAQRRIRHSFGLNYSSREALMTRCLCRIVFNSTIKIMYTEVRSRDKRQIPYFMSVLALKELIS